MKSEYIKVYFQIKTSVCVLSLKMKGKQYTKFKFLLLLLFKIRAKCPKEGI